MVPIRNVSDRRIRSVSACVRAAGVADRLRAAGHGRREVKVPTLDVLGAVAVRLLHVDAQSLAVCTSQGAVDPQASAGGELDDDQPDRLVHREVAERVPVRGQRPYIEGDR